MKLPGASFRLPRVLGDVSLIAVGGYVSTGLQLVRGLVLATLLGPQGLGTVAFVGMVLAYAQYADLGIAEAVRREIPLSLGAGRGDEAPVWRGYAIGGKLLTGAVLGLAICLYVVVAWGDLSSDLRFGLLTAAVIVSLQGVTTAQQVVFGAQQQFGRAAALMVIVAGANLAAVFAFVPLWGVMGAFAGQLMAFALAFVAAFVLGGWLPRVGLDLRRLRHLLSVGLPLIALNFMGFNLIYLDQLMVVTLLDTTALGVYSIVLYTGAALYLLPGAVAGSVGPRLLKRYGRSGTIESIRRLTWLPADAMAAVMPLVCALAWIVVPALIVWLLPDFSSAIAPVRIYVVGSAFLGVNLAVSTTLLALNKHRYNVPLLLGSIGLNVLLDLVFVAWLELGLPGIALGSALSYFSYWMAHTCLVRRYFGQSLPSAVLANLVSAWPVFVLAAVTVSAWLSGALDESSLHSELWLLPLFAALAFFRWRWRVGAPPAARDESVSEGKRSGQGRSVAAE